MALVNINRKVSDPFYRYKMPRVIAKVEGRGNGIKTLVQNMSDVSKALNVPPSYPTKFLGIELGAQVIVDDEKDRYIVNGSHCTEKLQNTMYDFIDKFLLCPQCDNPETELLVVSSKDKIKVRCVACGYLNQIGHTHKLNTYIIKNPPISVEHRYNGTNGNGVDTESENKDIALTLLKEDMDPNLFKPEADVKWLSDTSAAAIAERIKNLSLRAVELTSNLDLEKTPEERLQIFHDYVRLHMVDATQESFYLILHESKRLDLDEKAILVICDLILDGPNIVAIISKYLELLKLFVSSRDNKGNRKMQTNLIYGIELAIVKFPEIANPNLSKIFLKLYNDDVIEEDAFLSWSRRKFSRYLKSKALVQKVHECAEKFINWLKSAEVESDESEDDVEFTQEMGSEEKTENMIDSLTRTELPKSNNDDEDINIDDI